MVATLVCLLAASVLFVSISRRLGFGSILGYLVAGVLIGPAGLGLVSDVEHISEISELGVLMLLFLIGLELRIQRIWVMRKAVFGLGLAQVVITSGVLACIAHLAGLSWAAAFIVGGGLALSSTAIVLPMLGERELLGSAAGRDAFAVLLFQDVASIPLIAMAPLLAGGGMQDAPHILDMVKGVAALAVIVLGGRFLVRPLFRIVGGARTPEIFTATALLVVVGAAALAKVAGVPMSMGAFAAGVVLAESEYRHELEADIQPFEGLLLGFFFISVGMSANVPLFLAEPGMILAGVGALLAAKAAIAFGLAKLRKQNLRTAIRFALAIPQGSEFAFVMFGAALAAGALAKAEVDRVTLVIALSMLLSPVLFSLSERWLIPRLDRKQARPFDTAEDARPAPVVICGFGRVGQIVGRMLLVRRIPFNALDPDPDNIEVLRRFGHKVYFGDPSRVDLLRAVGAGEAKVLVVCLSDVEANLKVVQAARRAFPDLRIIARARNRRHAHLLMDEGVETPVRETFFSSLRMSEMTLKETGMSAEEARRTVQTFREHDERALLDQHGIYRDEKQLIQTAAQTIEELKGLFDVDLKR